jgi:hypothetical protein
MSPIEIALLSHAASWISASTAVVGTVRLVPNKNASGPK